MNFSATRLALLRLIGAAVSVRSVRPATTRMALVVLGAFIQIIAVEIAAATDAAPGSPNVPLHFLKGPDIEANEDDALQSFPNWATQISPGPAAESQQSVRFEVSNKDNTLFAIQPAISPEGTLSFLPAHGAFGTTLVTVFAQDDGGMESGGEDTSEEQTFTITLHPVNDPPVFEKREDPVVGENSGETVLPGWACHIGPGSQFEVGQMFQFLVSNDNSALFSVPPAISSDGTLRIATSPGANGSARMTVVLRDDGGTERGGRDTSEPQIFTITVVPANHPPVALIKASPLASFSQFPTNAVVISANNRDAVIHLDGSESFDAEGDALAFSWFADEATLPFAAGAAASITFDVGQHTITLIADDGRTSGTSELQMEVVTPEMAAEGIIQLLHETRLTRREKQVLELPLRAASHAFEHGHFKKGVAHLMVFQGAVRAIVWRRDRAAAKMLQAPAQEIIEAVLRCGSRPSR